MAKAVRDCAAAIAAGEPRAHQSFGAALTSFVASLPPLEASMGPEGQKFSATMVEEIRTVFGLVDEKDTRPFLRGFGTGTLCAAALEHQVSAGACLRTLGVVFELLRVATGEIGCRSELTIKEFIEAGGLQSALGLFEAREWLHPSKRVAKRRALLGTHIFWSGVVLDGIFLCLAEMLRFPMATNLVRRARPSSALSFALYVAGSFADETCAPMLRDLPTSGHGARNRPCRESAALFLLNATIQYDQLAHQSIANQSIAKVTLSDEMRLHTPTLLKHVDRESILQHLTAGLKHEPRNATVQHFLGALCNMSHSNEKTHSWDHDAPQHLVIKAVSAVQSCLVRFTDDPAIISASVDVLGRCVSDEAIDSPRNAAIETLWAQELDDDGAMRILALLRHEKEQIKTHAHQLINGALKTLPCASRVLLGAKMLPPNSALMQKRVDVEAKLDADTKKKIVAGGGLTIPSMVEHQVVDLAVQLGWTSITTCGSVNTHDPSKSGPLRAKGNSYTVQSHKVKHDLLSAPRCFNPNCPAAAAPAKLLKCAACRQAEYCSAACQKDDWKRHKRVCVEC